MRALNKGWKLALRYLRYLRRSKTKHGVHSPFVFDFITKVLEDHTHYPAYDLVEAQRDKLLHNKNQIEVVDLGVLAGKKKYSTYLERVKNIAKKSGISPSQGKLLHRIVKYFQPNIMVELGTSLGISSMYQVSASPESFFVGIEGCASTASFADQNIALFSENKTFLVVMGGFDVMLPQVLQKLEKVDHAFIDGNHAYKPTLKYFSLLLPKLHENSILIFHDIHWSSEMEHAWQDIIKNSSVTISIDLFSMGIVFFRTGTPKQDFVIRF